MSTEDITHENNTPQTQNDSLTLNTEFENIVPWNGANDRGRDVRLKWERNFEKIRNNFLILQDLQSFFKPVYNEDGKISYLLTRYSIATEGGITSYAVNHSKVDTVMDGIVTDEETITVQEINGIKKLVVIGGGSGDIDSKKLWQLLGAATDEQINISHLSAALKEYTTTTKMWELLKGNTTEQINESHLTDALKQYTKTEELSGKFVTTDETEQSILGIKNFTKGIKVGGQLINIVDGVLYLDCSIAVTGGVTTYAQGTRTADTIMDGIVTDETTISVQEINGVKTLVALGGSGSGDFNQDKLWELLGTEGENQIDKSHLTTALDGYLNSTEADKFYVKKVGDKMTGALSVPQINGGGSNLTIGNIDNNSYIVFQEDVKQKDSKWSVSNTGNAAFLDIKIGSSKIRIYENEGVAYIDGDLAVSGGITSFASAGRSVSTITDGVAIDGITIKRNSSGALYVDGDLTGGVTNWKDLQGKPTWITDTNPSYTKAESDKRYALKSSESEYFVRNRFTVTSENDTKLYTLNGSAVDASDSNWKGAYFGFNAQSSNSTLVFRLLTGNTTTGVTNRVRVNFAVDGNRWAGDWKTLAFTDGNVNSATKLQNKRTLWGQEFDGTQNVKGAMKDVSTFTALSEGTINFINDWGSLIFAYDSFRPASTSSNKFNLGNSDSKFKDLYLGGRINLNGLELYKDEDSTFHTSSSITSGGNISLGNSSGGEYKMFGTTILRWNGASYNNLMISGFGNTMYIRPNGTNSATGEIQIAKDGVVTINGDIKVKGNILAEGGVTAYSNFSGSGGGSITVIDNLTSSSTTAALSANQGRILKNLIDNIETGGGGSTSGVVTGIGTSGNYLTYVKDGVTKNIIVPYATNANTLGGTAKGSLFTALSSNSSTNLSLTIGGTTKTLTNVYAYKADSLTTPRTLWGRSFDGSSPVSGSLTGVGSITPSANNVYDLGSLDYRFKDLYVAGRVYVGSRNFYVDEWHVLCTDASLTVGSNLTVQGGQLKVQGQIVINSPYGKNTVLASAGTTLYLRPNGEGSTSGQASLTTGGTLTVTKLTQSSDVRLRSDIGMLSNRGYVKPITYTMNGVKHIGFSAQDVNDLYPELVEDDGTDNHYLSMNYSQYVAVLQAQIIELNERIKNLEQLNN